MSGPSLTMNLVNPGDMAPSGENAQVPFYFGVCSDGTVNEVYRFGDPTEMRETLGKGHLVDVLADAFACGVPEVRCMPLAVATAGTAEVTDTDATLTVDDITGTPLHFASGVIEITEGGALISSGNCKGRYALDYYGVPGVDPGWSDEFTIPADGEVEIPALGLTVHIATAQTPDAGDSCPFAVTPGHYNAAGVSATAVEDGLKGPVADGYTYLVFTGEAATASAANTIGLAINGLLQELYNEGYYCGALYGSGQDTDTATVTAFAANIANPPFASPGYGEFYVTNSYSEQGRATIALREHEVAARRIARIAVSTDPGRVASGPLERVVGIAYDAAIEGDVLHDNRVSAGRTWRPRAKGFFIQRQRVLDKTDGNFKAWPHVAVMVTALRAVDRVMTRTVLETLRRTATGTMDPNDAKDLETAAHAEIDAVLGDSQTDVRGRPGHISARKVTVSRSTVLPAVRFDVRIRPKDYPTDLQAFVMYADEV
jgi:hypothetical protein